MAIERETHGFENVGADTAGESLQVAQASVEEPAAQAESVPAIVVIEVQDGSILRLPEGTSIDEPRVNGANLEFVQPDGTIIVVPNGAITGLTIFIGNVLIPPIAVAALFEDNGIETAAGPEGGAEGPQSSGGNFARAPGDIGPGLPWGGLLPPTGLAFGPPELPERFAALVEETDEPVPNGFPTVDTNATVLLDDEAATTPYAAANTGGTDDQSPDTVNTTGTLAFSFGPDGTGTVLLLGAGLPAFDAGTLAAEGEFTQEVSADGLTLIIHQVQNGVDVPVLQVTLGDTTSGNYTVEQLNPIFHPTPGTSEENVQFTLDYRVTDGNGDFVDGTLSIDVDDDSPTAADDGNLASFTENVSGQTIGTVAGILGNDSYGADGAHATTPIAIGTGSLGGTVTIDGSGNLVYTNTTYDVSGGAATETFTYTITDGDGDETTATFTVTLSDAGVTMGAATDLAVDEDNIAGAGGNAGGPGDDGQQLTGSVSYTLGALDNVQSVMLSTTGNATGLTTLDGTPVATFWNSGTNTLIGYKSGGSPTTAADQVFTIAVTSVTNSGANYAITWLQPVTHPVQDDPSTGATETIFEDNLNFDVTVTVTDDDGSSNTTTFNVDVDDDSPTAVTTALVQAVVDEDGLANALSDGNLDTARPGEVAGTGLATATGAPGALNAVVNFGSDGPHPTSAFGLVVQTTPVDSGANSKGGDVLIVSNGAALTGYVDVDGIPGFDPLTDRAVFTLTVGGDGSYSFTLLDQIDHPLLNGLAGDDAENLLDNSGIDLSAFIIATDGDGDSVPLAANTFKVQVLDDIPTIVAREAEESAEPVTETIVYTVQAGNTDVRGLDGTNDFDIKLTGQDLTEADDSVNTNNGKIGIGDGQIIDGRETSGPKNNPNLSGPEILTLDFVKSLSITPNNPNPPIITDGGSYDVSSVTFSIDVAEAQQIEEAVLFIGASDDGVFEPLTVKINGVVTVGTPVFDGANQVGYAFAGVPDGATIEVIGATPFDQLRVGNYNDFTFDSDAVGTDAMLTGGNSFKIFGIESTITTTVTVTETFKVSHDESAGVNTAADPNPADDTGDDPPDLIEEVGALGYARSSTSVLSLFNASIGADEDGTYSFAITDAAGNAFSGEPSGLFNLDGVEIMLSTDSSGVLVGAVGDDIYFKVYVDPTGIVWIAQYLPIAHDLDGAGAAAFDDIASITADLRIKASLTDFDGDTVTAVSDVALAVSFQDDGLTTVEDEDEVTEDGPAADGNVVTGSGGTDLNTTDGNADTLGTDGLGQVVWDNAVANAVAGQYGILTVSANGDYSYTLYTQAQNPAAYAAVQGLAQGETLQEEFGHTVFDGDGDSAPSTLTITINGADDGVAITGLTPSTEGGDTVVNEKGLPARSGEPEGSGEAQNPAPDTDNSETNTGTFTIDAPDGLGYVKINGVEVIDTNGNLTGNAVVTTLGTLTVTGYVPATGVVSYSYTLNDNSLAHSLAGTDEIFDDLAVELADDDGSVATATLSVKILDDVPVAADDTDAVTEGLGNVADGNVFTGTGGSDGNATDGVADNIGADGAAAGGAVTGARLGTDGGDGRRGDDHGYLWRPADQPGRQLHLYADDGIDPHGSDERDLHLPDQRRGWRHGPGRAGDHARPGPAGSRYDG
jgi:VCBS repeat-containing protein